MLSVGETPIKTEIMGVSTIKAWVLPPMDSLYTQRIFLIILYLHYPLRWYSLV